MSNATGIVYRHPPEDSREEYGERLGYYIYQGSSGTACTRIFPTEEEAWKANRTDRAYAECSCGQEPTPVILRSTYGGGFSWGSTVCLPCAAIVGWRGRFEEDEAEERKNRWGFWGPA